MGGAESRIECNKNVSSNPEEFHSESPLKKVRMNESVSTESSDIDYDLNDAFGWFEDTDENAGREQSSSPAVNYFHTSTTGMTRAVTLPVPLTCPPVYVLESSLSSQQLWYQTAGRRPQQPPEERKYFEKLWGENFQASSATYSKNRNRQKIGLNGQEIEITLRGTGIASTAVSKAFVRKRYSSFTIQMPRFRIVRTADGVLHAEYLVVVGLDSVSFGVWRRFSEFKMLWSRVLQMSRDNLGTMSEDNPFKNSLASWQCLVHRQRWFRCLDKDYLGLKCFLLERFMHDLLFESDTPDLIIDFLGL